MSNICSYCLTNNPDGQINCLSCGAVISVSGTVPDVNHLSVGSLLNNQQYQVEKTLGQGGFAITYKATDLKTNSVVAIKELWPDRAAREGTKVIWPYSITPQERKEQILKFQDEAQKVKQFKHPSIVKVYHDFEDNNTVYIVMEFISGKTLYKILQETGNISEQSLKKIFFTISLCSQNNSWAKLTPQRY